MSEWRRAQAKTPGCFAVVAWSAAIPGFYYSVFDYDVWTLPEGEPLIQPIEGAGIDGELLPTVEDLIAASQGAIEWKGQEELVRLLIFDPYRRSRYAGQRIHALVERALRSVA